MWRKRMQDFSRSVGKSHAPLFAPVLFGVAAQIEAIGPEVIANDPTKLRKNVGELRRALGLDAVYCAAPSQAQVKAIGPFGIEASPESVAREEGFAASLEAVRQWQADMSEPVIVAALHGPARIQTIMQSSGCDASDEALLQHIGRGLAAMVRLLAEAGMHVVQFHEDRLPAEPSATCWKGALGTASNVARFHRVAPLLVIADTTVEQWPAQTIPCPTLEQQAGSISRPHGRAWPAEPVDWLCLPDETVSERVVTTTAEVRPDITIAELMVQIRRIRNLQ